MDQHDNPYDVGMSGLLGYGACHEAMHDCDLLVLLGTDFPYVQFMPTRPKIVQVDLRRERLGASGWTWVSGGCQGDPEGAAVPGARAVGPRLP